MRIPNYKCLDCDINTFKTDEYYMVHDVLWRQAGMKKKGMLCIDCLERRIGRQLNASDFKACELTRLKMTTNQKLMSRYNSAEAECLNKAN